MIIDISDLHKEYAKRMAGLGRVHDGSKHKEGSGYWLCDVTGVNEVGELLLRSHHSLHIGVSSVIARLVPSVSEGTGRNNLVV